MQNLDVLFLLAALILFVLAAIPRTSSAPLVPADLACLTAAIALISGAV